MVNQVIEKNYLNKGGYHFIAYPKKGNKVYSTFIHRDDILGGVGADDNGYVGDSNIKFARMVGMDEVFTVVGLKEDSAGRNRTANRSSQRVDDYVERIPELKKIYKMYRICSLFINLSHPDIGKTGPAMFTVLTREHKTKKTGGDETNFKSRV